MSGTATVTVHVVHAEDAPAGGEGRRNSGRCARAVGVPEDAAKESKEGRKPSRRVRLKRPGRAYLWHCEVSKEGISGVRSGLVRG